MKLEMTWADTARTLAADFGQRAVAHDRDGSFPHANFADLQQAGFLALAAPRALGGQQASVAELGEVIGAIGYGCPATALVLSMQYLQQRGMARAGSPWPEPLARQLVREAVQGVSLANSLRVEPELGTPARGGLPATVARRTPEGWRLSGRKIYSTGAPILRWYAVWPRTDDAEPQVGTFLVRAGSPGVRIEESWDHLGLRASGSHDVVFDDVPTPLDHGMGIAPPGAQARDSNMQAEMTVLLGALYTGVARAARDWLLGFLRERIPASLGAPLATLPRVQEAVGRIERLIRTNALLLRLHAQRVDGGELPSATESGLIKVQVTEAAVQAVQEALALTSNHGLSRHNPLQRHLRDVLCGPVHTPQIDSVLVAAGREALLV